MGIELTHLRQKVHARDSRHLQVGNDNVRLLLFENAKCLFAVGRLRDVETPKLEVQLAEIAQVLVVVGHKD